MVASPMTVAIERWCEEEDVQAWTAQQVADIVGKSLDTIKRWHSQGDVVPSKEVEFGKTTVYLYTAEDVVAAQAFADTMYSGKRTDLEGDDSG